MTMRDPKPAPFSPALLCALTCAIGLSEPTPAAASVSYAASLDDVARLSQYVARVTPIGATSAWEDGRIITTTDVRIDTLIAGKADARGIKVRTLGGIVDGIGQRVEGEPSFPVGAPSIVFVAPALTASDDRVTIVARAQGQIAIDRDRTTGREIARVRNTGALLDKPVRIPNAAPTRLMTSLEATGVAEVTELAAQAWQKSHAR